MLETIRSQCRGVEDRVLREAMEKEVRLAIPLRRGPRIAPEVALAVRLRQEGKPWPEIYAAAVDPKLERQLHQAICAQLRHKVKLHLRRRRLREEETTRSQERYPPKSASARSWFLGAEKRT